MNEEYTHIIERLSDTVDAETRLLIRHAERFPWEFPKLLLLGGESVFFRQIKKKFDSFQVPCDLTTIPKFPYAAVIMDTEQGVSQQYRLSEDADLDNLYTPGSSCVSDALLYLLLNCGPLRKKRITIVGRGHAVQGLAENLLYMGATVEVAHSKTEDMFAATAGRDIVIYATPRLTQEIAYDTRGMVIDLSGCVPHPELLDCPYIDRIGRLTVSMVLNRFVRKVVSE